MTTMIMWIFLVFLAGADQPVGGILDSKTQCEETRAEIVAFAATQSIPILAISDCVPVSLKTKD